MYPPSSPELLRMTRERPKDMSRLMQVSLQILSGGSAGFVEVCLMQPLDVVKTRMQLQNTTKSTGQTYNGVIDVFVKMYRQEGLFSFWKGILPPVLAETPKRAVKFLAFEQTKPLYLFGSASPTPVTYTLAGFSAGFLEAFVINPFEVVKVAQQAEYGHMKKSSGTWGMTKSIVMKDGFGLNGLSKGLTATMARHATFNTIYFGFYHSMRNFAPAFEDKTKEFFRKVLLGFCAGSIASIVNIPFDVAKSRIQGPQPEPGVVKYRWCFNSVGIVYREEGFRALYKGLVPKVLRLGPGGAIMLLVFEYSYDFLMDHFS